MTRKGQVTIPKALRDRLGLQPGDELRWSIGEEGIVVRPATQSAGRGLLADAGPGADPEVVAEALEREIRSKRSGDWNGE